MEENKEYIIDIIQLSIYYLLATSKDINNKVEDIETYKMKNCVDILNTEYEIKNMKETIFYFQNSEEHIVNIISKKFSQMDIQKYKNLVKIATLKIGYYDSRYWYNNDICDVASEKDVEELANLIYYFCKDTEELIEEAKTNIYAKYELGNRLYDINRDKEAYKLIEESANAGYKQAIYKKIESKYLGIGIEKNEKQAFEELTDFVDKYVYYKANYLLGVMYYEGKAVKQDYKEAFEYFLAASFYNSEATYYLGLMNIYGQGVEKHIPIGKELLQKARLKKATDVLVNYIEDEKRVWVDDLYDFINRHGLSEEWDKEELKKIKNIKANKSIEETLESTINSADINIENIVDKVVGDIENMKDGEKATTYNLISKYKEFDRKNNTILLKLHKMILEKCKNKNIEIDYSEYIGMKLGMPFNIFFVKRSKAD